MVEPVTHHGENVKIPYRLFQDLVAYFFAETKDPQLEEKIRQEIKKKGVKIIQRDRYIKEFYNEEDTLR